jgi:hypothetical protein
MNEMRHIIIAWEASAMDGVARLAPWCAPIPTAYLIGRATVSHLRWPIWVGLIAAIVVESLGLATMATVLELREYNRSKRKMDPVAPVTVAIVLAATYLGVAMLLTVMLDTVPSLAVYAPAAFPLLSLTGVAILALRGDHQRRLAEIAIGRAERKAERRAERAERKAEHRIQNNKAAGNSSSIAGNIRPRAEIILAENPDISGSELGRRLGVSERRGRQLLVALEESKC